MMSLFLKTFLQTVCSNVKKGQNSYEFAFDRVFNPRSSQADVFEEISQLVQVRILFFRNNVLLN